MRMVMTSMIVFVAAMVRIPVRRISRVLGRVILAVRLAFGVRMPGILAVVLVLGAAASEKECGEGAGGEEEFHEVAGFWVKVGTCGVGRPHRTLAIAIRGAGPGFLGEASAPSGSSAN
jgi:hypothetical protein